MSLGHRANARDHVHKQEVRVNVQSLERRESWSDYWMVVEYSRFLGILRHRLFILHHRKGYLQVISRVEGSAM